MDFFLSLTTFTFLQYALIAALLSGVCSGVIGSWIVVRRQVFLCGGITHASFGGIGIAYYLGIDPTIGATIFAVLAAIVIEFISRKETIREDSAIGILWSVGMAVGLIFIFLTPGYSPNLLSFLFGNILTVDKNSIILLAVLTLLIVVLQMFLGRGVKFALFDRQYAKTQGVNTALISYCVSIITALAIVFSIRVVGIVLLLSLFTIPTIIASVFTQNLSKIVVLASFLAVMGNISGLWISYQWNIPASATTIIMLAVSLLIVKIISLWNEKNA